MVQKPRGNEPASNASRLRCRAPKAPMPICFTRSVNIIQKESMGNQESRRSDELQPSTTFKYADALLIDAFFEYLGFSDDLA